MSLFVPKAYALETSVSATVTGSLKSDRLIEKKESLLEKFRQKREEVTAKFKDRAAEVRAKIALGQAELTAINGTTLTVTKNGKTYTVLTGKFDSCETKLKRRFWGDLSLSEISVGDKLNVLGKFQTGSDTVIEGCVVRDTSVQMRFGIFFGQVTSKTSNGFVMSTKSDKRDNQTVTVDSNTKIVNRKGETILVTDIKVDDRVRVHGLWNNDLNTVTEVKSVKDFSLPVVTKTATPTP